MGNHIIDEDLRELVARLEPWAGDSDLAAIEEKRDHRPAFDASLYRVAAVVTGLVAAAATTIIAL